MKSVIILLLVFLTGCFSLKDKRVSSKVSVVLADTSERVSANVLREFNDSEYVKAKKALKFLNTLFPDLLYTNLPALFWMKSEIFDGLTITPRIGPKYILIDTDFQFDEEKLKSNYNYFKFAAILGHEVIGHAERGLDEKDTRELVDKRIIDILHNYPELIEKVKIE